MTHSPLRSYTTLLVILGWMHVVLFTLLGFVPLFILGEHSLLAESWWGQWALYASPAFGLLAGALWGLGYFIVSGAIRVLLDQRDLLEELLLTNRHILQNLESRQPGDRASKNDPFDLSDLKDSEEPIL